MTTRLRSIIALPIALLLTLPLVMTAIAQDPETTAGQLNIEDLEGVENAVSRSYAMDIGAFVEAAQGDSPDPVSPEGPILMLALVAGFDSPEHAEDAAATVRDRMQEQLSPENSGFQVMTSDIEDLGDTAFALSGSRRSGEVVDAIVVQDASWLYLVIAISENGSGADAARAVAEFALLSPSNSDDVMYDHTGRSRGGIWAKLPSENNANTLSGTRPIFDNQLFPPRDAESDD